jgi:hypothetical protein
VPSRAFWSRGPDLLWERSPESRTAPCRRASHRPRSSDRASEELNRGDRRQNDPTSLLLGDAIRRQIRFPRLARPPDKEPYLASGIARLLFGAVTLKSARQGRDSVCYTMPKKAFHSRASDPRFHPFDHAEIHAAAVEEAR